MAELLQVGFSVLVNVLMFGILLLAVAGVINIASIFIFGVRLPRKSIAGAILAILSVAGMAMSYHVESFKLFYVALAIGIVSMFLCE